ncbi:MAG: hypothetical protein ACREH5_06915 [Candidatus Omnitrophota bacterium]
MSPNLTKSNIDQCLDKALKAGAPEIAPSPGFDAIFWKKVMERQKEPRLVRLFRDLESWVPTPNFSGAVAVVLIAFLVGGTGGVYSIKNAPPSLIAQRSSVQYLSGFREFQGVPASSVAATYLKTIEEGDPA